MTEIPGSPKEDPKTQSFSNLSKPRLPAHERLGSFRIESILSSGGMGTVYRAFDESMKRHVAIKVLHPSLGLSNISQERFARESWIAGQLEHPNIIRVYMRGKEEGFQFFAMELADGGSLAEHIKGLRSDADSNQVSQTVGTAHVRFLLERFVLIAEALETIHSKGYIHRDIKPHNILLCGADQQFKLTDFGIAHADEMTKVTRAGDFIGTIKYMSPELLAAHRAGIDKRTDIYSLGVTIYEALTLSLPYDAETEEKYVGEILSGRVVPARRRNRRLPVDVETVLLKATDHDPDRRYQNAQELADDLRAILDDRPVKAKRSGPVRRAVKLLRRQRAAVVSVVVVLLATGSTGEWYYHRQRYEAEGDKALQLLQAAVASKVAPSDLDDKWNDLSDRVIEALDESPDDSLAFWYHRASSVFKIEQVEFNDKVVLLPISLNIIPDCNRKLKPYALITEIALAADSADLILFATIWGYYSPGQKASSFGTDFPIDSLFHNVPGVHTVDVRLISQHYRGVSLFQPKDKLENEKLEGLSRDSVRAAIRAGLFASMPTTSAAACKGQGSVIAANLLDSSVADPFMQDTAFEKLTVVIGAP